MAEIPIKYGKYLDEKGQEQKVIFIGSEKAIYDSDGKRLDEKIAEMKALLEELKNVKQELEDLAINNINITKDIPSLSLNVNENTNATLIKNATAENDYGTSLIDKTNGVDTVLTLKNNKAYLDNVELVDDNKLKDKASKSETRIILSSMPSGIESALSFASNYPNAIAPYTGREWADMGSPWNKYYGFVKTEGYYNDASGGWFYFLSSDGLTTKKRFFTASGWKTEWI